ncbi:MAG: 2'-5' RNA ligase family protein [Chloroflexota bacterium]
MSERHFVLAFPKLITADFKWIQTIRAEYDKQFSLVEPHFTLVFGTTAVSSTQLTNHVQQQFATTPPFRFVCRCATVVKDSFGPDTYTFLLPDEGNSQLIKLHDQLYTGILHGELRLDIPYLPHITIGSFAEPMESKQLADQLNHEGFEIVGAIESVQIVALGGGGITAVSTIPLAG